MEKILLPGLDKQLGFTLKNIETAGKKILVAGESAEYLAHKLAMSSGNQVSHIVSDHDALLSAKLKRPDGSDVNLKLMAFDATDFKDKTFDIIYSQGILSSAEQKSIIKEFRRILVGGGIVVTGEFIKKTPETPVFIADLFSANGLKLRNEEELLTFYTERNFSLLQKIDLSSTLTPYYKEVNDLLKSSTKTLSSSEKSFHKKIIHKISHECNIFLKMDGLKHVGFHSYIFRLDQ